MATSGDPNLQSAAEVATNPSDELVNLPSGKPLREDGASDVLRANATPIVLLAGAAKSGKTTLLASLHDSFQRGPFAGYFAAGSRTLIGFEERCFDSRAASGAEYPATVRTRPAEGLVFYHMKLRNEDQKSPTKHLLVADMSGEHYSGALDSATEMRALTIIRRADHFVHLIDAGKLVSREFSAHTQSNAMMLVRRCLEERMFARDAKVDVLLTKWDIVLSRCAEEKAKEMLKSQREAFNSAYRGQVARVRVFSVAARPHYKSPLHAPYGLSDLFRSWVEEPPRDSESEVRPLPLVNVSQGYDAFALREAPDLYEGKPDA